MNEQQYQFQRCVKKNNKQSLCLNDGDVLCSVPLNMLAPKLTLKAAKELANLHDMYMPSKILLKNAQILLENHECETCPDLLAVFEPYRVASNTERQKTWYEKNVLSMISTVIQHLDIMSLIKLHQKNTIGPRKI